MRRLYTLKYRNSQETTTNEITIIVPVIIPMGTLLIILIISNGVQRSPLGAASDYPFHVGVY
jgi:hypothetical protein